MSSTNFPAIPDPIPTLEGLYASILPLKQAMEMLVGTRGNQSVVDGLATAATQLPPYSTASESMTSGYNLTTYKIPDTTGVIRLDARRGLIQRLSNTAITDVYAPFYDCVMTILIINATATPVIVWHGFTGGTHGDPITSNPDDRFLVWVVRVDGVATYQVQALQ